MHEKKIYLIYISAAFFKDVMRFRGVSPDTKGVFSSAELAILISSIITKRSHIQKY